MAKKKTKRTSQPALSVQDDYANILAGVVELLEAARRAAARSVNAVMTATYWEIGRRIVECEQGGDQRAEYGTALLKRLSADLSSRFGRGYGLTNLKQMRRFYLSFSALPIRQTPSDQPSPTEKSQTLSDFSGHQLSVISGRFPLPWSHYVRLLSVKKESARRFYEEEAIRGGWSFRQLDRQINTQFYERTLASKNQTAMLTKGQQSRAEDAVTPDEEVKDPYILEFLDLKDEYAESDLEAALIQNLESFLMELGGDFAFIGRQRRLRIDDEWYRIDLLFFHRRLRSLVIIDLKLGRFTHADAGQMHLYLNYAREHWVLEGENPPVGIILCASKSETLVKYALEGLPNKVLAAEYRTTLPSEEELAAKLEETRRRIESHDRLP
ncbi:MAG: DUF1016 family protein [Planctomycetaceae bacterium]|nr:DUF1016 family protein [Planctomycetaceae bacterium]